MNDIADPQMPSAASTAIIVPYFGEAPPWLPFFLKSCDFFLHAAVFVKF